MAATVTESQLEVSGKLACSHAAPEKIAGFGKTKKAGAGPGALPEQGDGLKAKIAQLEQVVAQEIKTARTRLEQLKSEKVDTSDDQVEELLDAMKAELEKEHATAQTEMEDYFAGLKSRNALIAEEVRDVKEENNALQKEVVALQRRLSLLEVALGE